MNICDGTQRDALGRFWNVQLYYAGNNDNSHDNGVAIVISGQIAKYVISDRLIIMVQLSSKPFITNSGCSVLSRIWFCCNEHSF